MTKSMADLLQDVMTDFIAECGFAKKEDLPDTDDFLQREDFDEVLKDSDVLENYALADDMPSLDEYVRCDDLDKEVEGILNNYDYVTKGDIPDLEELAGAVEDLQEELNVLRNRLARLETPMYVRATDKLRSWYYRAKEYVNSFLPN
jgi:hypothetical protein